MHNDLLQKKQRYKLRHKRLNIWRKIVVVLACIVVFCTTYALILPALTKEQVTYCGMEEHVHGPECYERRLICGYDEDVDPAIHVHTEECYEEVLICEKPEHKHTLACFSNPEADVETREVWERTVSEEKLTGLWADDIVAIARTQLGYKESTKNYIVMEDGETIKGYTRYGAWYGDAYGDWGAMFVSFCLDFAKIPNTSVPRDASCSNWVDTLSKNEWNLYRTADEYTPVKGDIVFFDDDGDGTADRVGIIAEYSTEASKMETIEGDFENKVQYAKYTIGEEKICGYCVLPEKENLKISEISEVTKSAVIYTDENYETLSEDDTEITLTGLIPAEAEVRAFPVTVETMQRVLCAYDISIVMPDGSIYEPAEGEKINVAIQSAEMNDEPALNTTAYYIPEDSAPVPMNTTVRNDGTVSFETDHFSVYALMNAGTMSAVYLNGATGNDNNAGTQSAPVKTFEKALSLVAENGTIYVSGTVTVNSAEEWSINVPGVKMQRASGFTGPLVIVANGGSLTLSELTMNGGCGTLPALLTNNNSRYSSTYATGSAKAPLIVVNTGGDLNVTDGTVLEYNSNKPNTNSSGAFAPSGYIGLGGAVYCNGTMTMTGGLIQHCEAQSGGGVYIENGSFRLNGGTIDHNYARNILPFNSTAATYRTNAGGGVYVSDNSTMIMSGGTVSNNQSSREGGGISLGWLDRTKGSAVYSYTSKFTMMGGTFTGNEALSTGGGLNVTAGNTATIFAGYFTNNSAYGYDSQGYANNGFYRVYSGGGIYVDANQWNSSGYHAGVPGELILHRVVITENSSDYQGGGIAACPDARTYINFNLGNGTAVYNNTANPALVGNNTEIAIKNMDSNDHVSDTVLGGGNYNWNWNTTPSNGFTNYGNNLNDSSPEIITARSMATVWITDNHGYLGGGIGCNGIIEAGGELNPDTVYIAITKVWEDGGAQHPEYITVQVLRDGQPYGPPIKIYKTIGPDNQEIWPTYYVDDLPTGYTYSIEEVSVPGYYSVVTQSGNNFTVTNTEVDFGVLKKWAGDTEADRPSSITVQLYQNGITYGDPVQLTAANGWLYNWTNLPEKDGNGIPYVYTIGELNTPNTYYCSASGFSPESGIWEITNTKIETTDISAEKRWAAGTQPAQSVTLQLLADGQNCGSPVVLNSDNNWFYKWENLPMYTPENAPDGTPIAYTVTEINTPGYWATIVEADASAAGPAWQQVTAPLENGKTYLLVNTLNNVDRALAGLSTYQLQWLDVTNALSTGDTPSGTALWTFNNNTLQNAEGKYLILGDLSGSYVFFTDSSRVRTISLSGGILSALGGNYTRYFTGNLNQYNYGTTSTNQSQGMIFKIYTQVNDTANWGQTHYIVTNETAPDTIDVQFSKYSMSGDGGDPILIGGADLALYKQDAAGVTIPGTNIKGTLINQWTSGSAGQTGSVHIEDLEQGTYYLIETTTPDGHLGLTGPIIFTVDPATSQVIIVQYPGYSNMEGSNLFTGGSTALPVYNSAAYALPETGGSGTRQVVLGGLMLFVTSAALLYIRSRRREREYEHGTA